MLHQDLFGETSLYVTVLQNDEHTVPAEISCFITSRNWKRPSPKVIEAKKYELNRQNNG